MILKASQRGGGKQLALHLLNIADNEHVQVHDMRGFVSDDLVGAMKEAHAVSKGTRCKQFLFSISLNPPETENVPPETFEDALARIETKTGLTGQPRAVVFHEKQGRRHCHAVYSRIDPESMTAINLPHYKLKLRDISKELYHEHDWHMPKGLVDSAAKDPRSYTLAEYQQSKRVDRDPRDLKSMMQECWAASDSAAAFAHALKERGITLAKGDRRGHVAVTHEGEVLSISRYVGKTAKDVRARLGEPQALPGVDDAKASAATAMSAAMTRHIAEARLQHREAMSPLDIRRQAMTEAHRLERLRVEDGQKQRWDAETLARSQRLNTGLRGLWDRVTGQRKRTEHQNIAEAQAALQRDAEQCQAMIEAQLVDRRALQNEIKAARDKQAEALRELRADRSQERAKVAALERGAPHIPDRTKPDKDVRAQEPSQDRPRRRGQGISQAFERHAPPEPPEARPTPEERLDRLRRGDGPTRPEPERGPER